MKKEWILLTLISLSLFLGACSVTSSAVDSNIIENESSSSLKGTFRIGEKIFSESDNNYYFGGVVHDSVVIDAVLGEVIGLSRTIPFLYIDITNKHSIKLPKSTTSLQLESINRTKGTVSLKLIKKRR